MTIEDKVKKETSKEAGCATLIYGSVAAINYGLALYVDDWKKAAFFVIGGTLCALPAAYYYKEHKSLTK